MYTYTKFGGESAQAFQSTQYSLAGNINTPAYKVSMLPVFVYVLRIVLLHEVSGMAGISFTVIEEECPSKRLGRMLLKLLIQNETLKGS